MSLEKMYGYLCMGRYPQEEPAYVRAILHMVDDHDIGFYSALEAATHFCGNNSGHHIVYKSAPYHRAKYKDVNEEEVREWFKFDLYHMAQFVKFMRGGDKNEPLSEIDHLKRSFRLHEEMYKMKLKVKPAELTVTRDDLVKGKSEEKILKAIS
jgi:hypothetical protein